MKNSYQLYIIFLLPLLWFIIFCYLPMYGVTIAFKDFQISKGIMESPWVGLDHFKRFLTNFQFTRILLNTISLSLYNLLAGMPFAIMLALALHYCDLKYFKRFSQTLTYAPHFISTVVAVGIIIQLLHPKLGIINQIIQAWGGTPVSFMSKPEFFANVFVWSEIWQHAGWASIIYIAALAGVDPELHEAAIVDGASKVKRAVYIDLPCIMPTIVITLLLSIGEILMLGFEKVYLMQNDLNLSRSEIIDTYVYKVGLLSRLPNYSYATAIGLFNSLVGIVLLIIANEIAKKVSDTKLW